MRKLIITLLAAVLASGAFAQSSFPDIPANHWAGDAVDRIADLGIVIGFPDGTFRGNEAFTRYQAALVVSRMLDVVNDNVNSALALTQADLDSLRNAVQELASDVAAQGVRLSAAESAIAGLSDDVTANTARLDDLEAAVAAAGGVPPAVLRDLQNQIASQRVAIDTAQAQADAAAARADDAYSLANQALTLGRQNAEDLANLNRVVQLMQRDIAGLKGAEPTVVGAPTDLSGVNSAIERNRSDIANIREFVILLRRDQVAIRDRVSALEASDAEQSAAIADLQARVNALEENPLGISGSITVTYYVGRVDGPAFDVDRAYGLNADRNMGASVFSTGAAELSVPADAEGSRDYKTQVGEVAQDRHDITQTSGNAVGTLKLSLKSDEFGFNGEGSPNKLNSFSGVLTVTVGYTGGTLVYNVDDFMTTFEPIGATPLTFSFGTNVKTSFTPYVVRTNDPGFVATVGAPDFLAFLDPSITAVYTAPQDTSVTPAVPMDAYLRGIRATVSPLQGLTIGGSFAQYAENAADHADVLADNDQRTVYGVDGSLALSIFDLGFEWANGSGGATAESILYATLDIDASGLPIIESLSANYRNITDSWTTAGNNYNLGASTSGFPFVQDQAGFGVDATFDLFNIVELGGYFDSFSVVAGDSATSFGVDAKANLFAGFSLSGWYHQTAINGTTVDDLRTGVDGTEAVVVAGMNRNTNHNTGFGVDLKHDGAADNALISGLNINAGYSQTEADFSKTTIYANADYKLNVSIVTLTPYVGYRMVNDTDAGATNTSTIKAGTGLETAALDIYTKPSLLAAVNYRTTDYTGGSVYTASELQWSVGLVLNEFIFDNSKLTAKYANWTGTNINNVTNTRGAGDSATDISAGDVAGTGTQSVNGYEVIWNYFDLEFAYGVYTNDNAGTLSAAQAFQITYAVTF